MIILCDRMINNFKSLDVNVFTIDNLKKQYYETGLNVEPSGKEKDGEVKYSWRRDLEADIK